MSEAGNVQKAASMAPLATPSVPGVSSNRTWNSKFVACHGYEWYFTCSTERINISELEVEFHVVRAISGDTADGLRRVEDNVTQEFSLSRLSEDR